MADVLAAPIGQDAEFAQLKASFVWDNPEAIIKFLNARPGLRGLVLESVVPLRQCFGIEPVLRLNVGGDGYSDVLYVLVSWLGDRTSGKNAFNRFLSNWWLSNSLRGDGDVVFDYDLT